MFVIHNLAIILLSLTILYDIKFKIKDKYRVKIYKAYKYALVVSILLTVVSLIYILIENWSMGITLSAWFGLCLSVALIAC